MPDTSDAARRNRRIALICAAVISTMVGAAFASVPLYRAFCQATGFNGTVRRAADVQGAANETITVRFDTNVNGIDWKFEPSQASQTIHFGEHKLAFFRATNMSTRPLTGRAVYNVVPETAGPYFSKLECFCFKNQTLAPGQTMEFPVVYTVDARYAKDRDNATQKQITLSYTFFAAVVGPGADPSAAKSAQTGRQSASPLGGSGRAGL